MRIGIDARELSGRPTGTGRYLASLLHRWLGEPDLHLTLFTNRPEGRLSAWRPNAAVVSLPASHGTWFEQVRLPRALGRHCLDVFFAPAFSCPVLTRVPRVTAVHDLSFFSVPDDFEWNEGLRRRVLVGASIRSSVVILTLSDFMRGEIASHFPDAAGRTRVIPLAAEPSVTRAPSFAPPTPPVLVSIGSLFNRRRMPELLEACSLLKRRGTAFVLHVMGDNRTHPRWDGPREARALGLGDSVVFGGYEDEATREALLSSATAALYLSRYEGFGLPALEALAAGIPLIVSDDRPLNELFGAAALVVDASNPTVLAQGIGRVLGDDAYRAELTRRGPQLARRFSWDTCAANTLQALRDAANGRP